jgi:hypothetical protein
MQISTRALFTLLHGMLFGGFFILAIFGVAVELFRSKFEDRPAELSPRGYFWERVYLIGTVVLGWLAVFLGAYVVYPWYRAIPPAGLANLAGYPQALLQSNPATSGWHEVGMEWKEHVAWFAPMTMTAVAYLLLCCRPVLKQLPRARTAILSFALFALVAACIAGFFGAMINKAAPVQGGSTIYLAGGDR